MVHCVVGCRKVDESSSSDQSFLIPIFDELCEVQELTSAGFSWPEACLLRDEVFIKKTGQHGSEVVAQKACMYDIAMRWNMYTEMNSWWVPSLANFGTVLLFNQASDNYFVKYQFPF